MTDSPNCPICNNSSQYDFSGRDLMFGLHKRYDFYKCKGCGAVFQDPMPDPEQIASFYPEEYGVYSEDTRVRHLSGFRKALLNQYRGYKHLDVPSHLRLAARLWNASHRIGTPAFGNGGKMLDMGCGNGRYLLTMRKLGWQVEGVEFSESGVRVCQKENLTVHHGDLPSANFEDGRFDLITVRHVVEHIPEPQAFMAELARILKPQGRLVMETPNANALGRSWFGPNWYANDVPRHLILFTPDNLALLAGQHGLQESSRVVETSPKIVLNSIDYVTDNTGKPSKRRWARRLLAQIYVFMAKRSDRGDTFQITFVKP